MPLSGPVDQQQVEIRALGHVDIPHPVEPASPRLGRGAVPRNEIAEDMPAGPALAERERIVEEADEIRRRASLLQRAAPGDIAGVTRLDLGKQPAPQVGVRAIGADQQVRRDLATLREARDDSPRRLLEPGQGLAGVVALVGERRAERPVDRVPRRRSHRHDGGDAVAAVRGEVLPGHALDVVRVDFTNGGDVIVNCPPTERDLALGQEHGLEEEGILAIYKGRFQLILGRFQFALPYQIFLKSLDLFI